LCLSGPPVAPAPGEDGAVLAAPLEGDEVVVVDLEATGGLERADSGAVGVNAA